MKTKNLTLAVLSLFIGSVQADWGFMQNLWYQIKAKHKGASWKSGEIDAWDVVSFSVHEDEHKIYILGERIKTYQVDKPVNVFFATFLGLKN